MKSANMATLNKKIIIATHYLVYGAPQALRDYLIAKRVKKLVFIGHPIFVDQSKSYYENIENGIVVGGKMFNWRIPVAVFNYPLEIILNFFWVLKSKAKYDVFVGVDSLNAFVGIILKQIGRVRKVIFYTIDYVPQRFDNRPLNTIYHWLDKFCLKHSDEIWNVSPRIAEGREKIRGLKKNVYKKQKVVPIGIWYEKVKRLPFNKIKKHQLFFLGHILESAGIQIVLNVIPRLVKNIPDFHFVIVGGGEYEDDVRNLIKKLHIEKYCTCKGWIKEREKIDTIMCDSALAIAMYDKNKSKTTYYADPTKLKDYLSAGLPIIMTDLPHNAEDIRLHKCGIIVDYNENEVYKAILYLMKNEDILKAYRSNGLKYVKLFDWKNIFNTHFLPLVQ